MHSTCLKVRCRIEQEKKRHQSGTVRLLDCVVIESIVRDWNIKNIEELDLVQTSYVVLPLPCENSFPPEKSGFNFPPRRYRRTIFWCCSEDSIFFQSASHPSPFGKITRKTRCFFRFSSERNVCVIVHWISPRIQYWLSWQHCFFKVSNNIQCVLINQVLKLVAINHQFLPSKLNQNCGWLIRKLMYLLKWENFNMFLVNF